MYPAISVIMSLYNTPKEWLIQSVESILNQTYECFEFIIIADCPSDNSVALIEEYAERDDRIVIIKNSTNKGLTENLNRAVSIARGKYIARMDSDDISCVNRFEKQIKYLEENQDVAVVGSLVNAFSSTGNRIGMSNLSENMEVTRIRMLFSNSGVAHPSAMIRREFLSKHNINYNVAYKKSQDYALWVDILNAGGKIRVLPEILLNYRVHDNQISSKMGSEQNYCARQIIKTQLVKLMTDINDEEFSAHMGLSIFNCEITPKCYTEYIKKIIRINKDKKIYDHSYLKKEVLSLWQKNVFRASRLNKLGYLFTSVSLRSFAPSIFFYNLKKLFTRNQHKKILKRYLNEK